MDIRDEIKSRLSIEQVVGQYCQLTRKGRNLVCLCPFHNDKRPSFLVSPDKGIGYCFACQTGGDIFSFVQKIENVDFPGALKILADRAGVQLPTRESPARQHEERDAKERARECLEAAREFYISKLSVSPVAAEYVAKRGVPAELSARFGIGYAPDSFSETYEYLLKKGFSKSEIISSGLGVQKDLAEARVFDRFRHRIMFPIMNAQGGIIGFGGRALRDEDAKYLNSPDGPLYHKSNVLFGLSLAREAIRKNRRVMLVEGYFDVVAAHKAGMENVVAVSGTALTEEHVRILKRYADSVVLCLDQDTAGQTAADRGFQLLARQSLAIESVSLPAKDPDELVQKDPAMFMHLVEKSTVPYLDAVIGKLSADPDISAPQARRNLSDKLFPLLQALPSSVELREYLRKAAAALGTLESELLSDFSASRIPVPKRRESGNPAIMETTPFSSYELCLGLGLMYPAQRQLIKELIPEDNEALVKLRDAIIGAAPGASAQDIIQALEAEPEHSEKIQVLSLFCEENFAHWSDTMALREITKLCTRANRDIMIRKQRELIDQIRHARTSGSTEEEAMLLTKYQQVIKLAKMTV